MQPNRIGRMLGIGARVAGAKLTGTARAANAGAAGNSGAGTARPANAGAAGNSGAGPARPANAGAAATTAGAARLARGAGRFGAAFFKPFAHATSVLWNQIAGIFFALFAIFFIEHSWMVYKAAHGRDRHLYLYAALAGIFAWFTVNSFWRAWRRQRRG